MTVPRTSAATRCILRLRYLCSMVPGRMKRTSCWLSIRCVLTSTRAQFLCHRPSIHEAGVNGMMFSVLVNAAFARPRAVRCHTAGAWAESSSRRGHSHRALSEAAPGQPQDSKPFNGCVKVARQPVSDAWPICCPSQPSGPIGWCAVVWSASLLLLEGVIASLSA